LVIPILNRTILSAIVAMGINRAIGKNNQLLWRLPADLKHFKSLTTGHPILMGRKTFESIGKPLPNRTNIIITRKSNFDAPGCIIATSLAEAIEIGAENDTDIFIIGGAEIYRQLLPQIQRIYLTIVQQKFDGDTFFPELNEDEWQEVAHSDHAADAENPFAYSFVTLERIR
jgi:dihydrofolate reductase